MAEKTDREIIEAATNGPWETAVYETKTHEEATARIAENISHNTGTEIHGVWCPEHPQTTIGRDRQRPVHAVMACITGNGPNAENNAAFIVAARTRWPAALDEVERLKALLWEVLPYQLVIKRDLFNRIEAALQVKP